MALAALTYFMGFLQDWTWKDIDSGLGPIAGGTATNLLVLAAYGFIHSLLARPAIKRQLYASVSHRAERSVYNLLAGVLLAAVMWLWTPDAATLWQVREIPARLIQGLFVAAALTLVASIACIDMLHFFGLRQAFGMREPAGGLSRRGPYSVVRHPIQSSLIVMLWATPHMTVGHLTLAIALSAYSIIATLKLEERDLDASLGIEYEHYRLEVPALVPRLWKRRGGAENRAS